MTAVLLDALGTLLRLEPPGPALRAELRRRAGVEVSDERAAAAFRAEIDFYLDHHLEGSDPASLELLRDSCAAVLTEALGEPGLDAATAREAMLASIRFSAYPDAAPALARLRRRGAALVAVSNWDCSLPGVLERAGLRELLDGVVSSASVGTAKPDPAPFRAALALCAARPEDALHAGDSLELDVLGARRAGIEAVLVAREGSPPPGVRAIRTLEELPSLTFGDP